MQKGRPFTDLFCLRFLQGPSTVVGRGSEFELWRAGYYTVIHFSSQDLTILWDRKTTVHIRAGPQWKVWTRGCFFLPVKELANKL